MHIQEVFNAIYERHQYEYIVADMNMQCIEFSDKVIKYIDIEEASQMYVSIMKLIPELIGLEKELMQIGKGERANLELPLIYKNGDYVTISVQAGRKNKFEAIETIIILFEDVTDFVKMQQKSIQDRNDKELLVLELDKANRMLAKYNKHITELVEKEVEKNVRLTNDIIVTQREVIATMGAIGETRSKETGDHVLRVGEYAKALALIIGLSSEEAEELRMAAPMHDIGKVGIEDAILNKPGKLTEEEFEIMKQHSLLGYEMLSGSQQKLLQTAAIVAYEHHEKWDGSGYPRGLKGENIHIYGRIIAIVDVFDALGHDRVYKKAWPLDKILNYIESGKAKQFDPFLVENFLKNIQVFTDIQERYKNKEKGMLEHS
ncbi:MULTISPECIES: HD-GYP domain-containing protein [Sulfurimonas]|uniref:HD-GYP domain-containing protein n=1 Tax=Sulfurimonas TaxID=202746 RepID=UPI00125EA0DD|nr:HD domain-containing phosphohydrolase [Sulfurimonas hydrogeniphila]